MFLRNVGKHLQDYTVSHPVTQYHRHEQDFSHITSVKYS